MYLTSVQLENFRRFAFAQIDFPDGVVGIIGNNGAGKSTIIEAVAWALYGNDASRTDKEQIKRLGARPQDICRVILDFQMNGDNFRVVREMRGKSDMPDASVIVNKEIVVRGSTPAIDFVKKSLNMDFRAFMTSFYARQKELNALSDFAPYQRKEVLLRMLGIEDVDLALKDLRSDKKDLDTKLEVSRAQKEDINLLRGEKEKIEKNLKSLKDGLKDKKLEFEESVKLLQKREEEFIQQKEKFNLFNRLSNNLQVQNNQKKNLEEQINLQKAEKERLLILERDLVKLQGELVDYEKVKKMRDEYKSLKHFEKLERLMEEDKKAKKEKELEIEKKKQLKDELSSVQKEKGILEEKLNECIKIYAELNAEEKQIHRQIEKLENNLQNIENLGPDAKCDRCLRLLGDDFPKIKSHILQELEELNLKLDNLKIKKSEIEVKGNKIKDEKSEKDKFTNNAKIEVAGLPSDEKELVNIDKRYEEKRKSAEDFSRDLSSLSQIKYDEKEHEKIENRFTVLEKKKSQADMLQGEIKRIKQIENMIIDCQNKIKDVEMQIKEIRNKLEELSFSTEEHTNVERKVKEAQNKLNQKQMALKEAEHGIELVHRDLGAIEDKIKSSQKIEDEIKVWSIDRTYLEKLETILGDFKLSLIGRIRPTLSSYASQLLTELTEGKYQELELNEDYEIYITDNGERFPLERFSGGEKDLANLCLRLAISFMISESSGVGFSFIILDEIFGSQDALRKENIINLLAKLKGRFRQIFLITHIDDIKDSVENLLYVVESENGTSQVIMQ